MLLDMEDPTAEFIEAACVPLDRGHATGTLSQAERILAAHPEVAGASIHTAAILGDDAAVRAFLETDRGLAVAKAAPRGWDALTHLCFSRYLRLDPSRSDGFVRAARALLDAGADANTGWWERGGGGEPMWEPVLYGAAGIAHHAELTQLLLERGADPNDDEVVYHTPESYDNRAMRLLVESGRLTHESLSLMLIRKHDWHDADGVRWLLEHGLDLNRDRLRGFRPIHHATERDNGLEIFEALLDHGADPTLVEDGVSAVALAARYGRGDVLALYERRGIPIELDGVDRLTAACARADAATVRSLAAGEPDTVAELRAHGGDPLVRFAGTGNAAGVRLLLDLGVDVAAPSQGDRYWGLVEGTTALHAAAWRAAHETVALLIDRGAPLEARDAQDRTPLALAVRACVDSYWADLRSPASVRALLEAGATTDGVVWPCGYTEVDEALRAHSARP